MMASLFQMNTASTSGTGSLPSNTVANPKGELKAITTRSGLVLDGPSVPMPPPFINPEEDERVEETFTDPEHAQVANPAGSRLDKTVHGEEMILRDGNERLILNMRNDTSSYSNEPHQESINMIDVYNVSHEEIPPQLTSPEVNDDIFDPEEDIIENLLNLDKTKDLPPYHDNQSSGNPTLISKPETKSSSSSPTLISLEESELIWEEFEAYLASDSFPHEIVILPSLLPPFHNSLSGSTTSSSPSLHISETSDYFLEEFADELAHITFPPGNDDLPFDAKSDLLEIRMFTDEHALDYSSPPLWDDYDDNLFDHESDNDNAYDDPFDFKEEKIKDSKILIDELDLPESNNVLPFPEYDSDFNPPLYELPFHKEVPGLGVVLSFSSENEEKVYNPGILTSKRVHTSLLPELSHRGTKAFKVTKILESPMEIFPCFYQEDIRSLDVPCLHFYPP
ncbi:hypothetical protein Tco_0789491 [Tanacetum coccineum]